MDKVLYIVNPASNGGAGMKVWQRFNRQLPTPVPAQDVLFTDGPDHGSQLASAARGYDLIVAVGGDGTVGEVISGILANQSDDPAPALAVLPTGTGNDIARQVGAYPLQKAITVLQNKRPKFYDLIAVDCQGDDGPKRRYAFVYGTAGFSAVVKFSPWMKRYLGTTIGTYVAMILALLDFDPPKLTITWDGGHYSGTLWMAIAANCEYAGGASIRLAPGAKTDDGVLDLLIIPAKSKPLMLATLLPKIPNGRHVNEPGVQFFRGTTMTIEADRPVLVEVDGDVFGRTPATFKVCPKALRVLSDWSDCR
ncbi:MAG TPA: diacylglycerol kinase family lipid kinase [Rhodospirillales bacterium]|nr:diacylglycerol kinase family lipid kinase [Rhodospirillales bacterium]